VPAIMSSVGGADWLESEKTFIGRGRSISEVSSYARKLPLVGVTERCITGDCRERCERVVDEDETSGYEIGSDWGWKQVGFSDEGSPSGITDDREPETETTVVGMAVISAPLCKVAPLLGIDRETRLAVDEVSLISDAAHGTAVSCRWLLSGG
jgi:hypothetical protein